MNLQQKISAHPEVTFQELEGESVLLHLTEARYYGLNDVGTRIWQLVKEHGSLDAVFEQICQEYAVEPQQLKVDLENLVDELVDQGLVILEPATPSRR